MSTPLDLYSAEFLKNNSDAIKISSGDNNFDNLINMCIKSKKKVIISLGLLNFKEKIRLITRIKKKYGLKYTKKNIAFLHCVSSYPVKDEDANLETISELKNKNKGMVIGYSDHTLGIDACIAARVLGAMVIEKHFTLDKNFSSFRDHKLSADFKDMLNLVRTIRRIENMTEKLRIDLSKSEKTMLKSVRRQPFALKKIGKGEISSKNIIFLRPSKYLKSENPNYYLGKKVNRTILENKLIKKEFIF